MQSIDDEIRVLAPAVWETVLSGRPEPHPEIPAGGNQFVSACVNISGAWNGSVAMRCDAALATKAAAVMFGLGDAEPSAVDVQDALCELTNMVGGNVKALLPEPSHLSLPSPLAEAGDSRENPRSRLISCVPFRSGLHFIVISLLQD